MGSAYDAGRLRASRNLVTVQRARIVGLEVAVDRLVRDFNDMYNCPCAIWVRCKGCGRLHNRGWQCPSDDCEEGT
jgi:hypothetical protein